MHPPKDDLSDDACNREDRLAGMGRSFGSIDMSDVNNELAAKRGLETGEEQTHSEEDRNRPTADE